MDTLRRRGEGGGSISSIFNKPLLKLLNSKIMEVCRIH